jgi:hypothetical protein
MLTKTIEANESIEANKLRLTLSPSLAVVLLFSFLGLALTSAVTPTLPDEAFGWTLTHIE